MLMASLAVLLTELLSAQVAITLESCSQSHFQYLLWSCMADWAGVLHSNCVLVQLHLFFFLTLEFLTVSIAIRLTGLWRGSELKPE